MCFLLVLPEAVVLSGFRLCYSWSCISAMPGDLQHPFMCLLVISRVCRFAFLKLHTVFVSFKNSSLPKRLTAVLHESVQRGSLRGARGWGPGWVALCSCLASCSLHAVPADRKGCAGGERGPGGGAPSALWGSWKKCPED